MATNKQISQLPAVTTVGDNDFLVVSQDGVASNKQISQLPAVTTVGDNDFLVVSQGGVASKATGGQVFASRIDSTLSVSGKAADAATVGARALLSGSEITSWATFQSSYGGDYDNLPVGRVMCIAANFPDALHAPVQGFIGTVTIPVHRSSGLRPGDSQIAIGSNGAVYLRYKGTSAWGAWVKLARVADVDDLSSGVASDIAALTAKSLTGYATMVTTAARLSTATGGTMDVGDLPVNRIVCFGASGSSLNALNYAEVGGYSTGTYLTVAYDPASGNGNGRTQIFIGTVGIATRWKTGGAWTKWSVQEYDPETYYVGTGHEYTSVSALFQSLAGNTRRKVVYIEPGTYDIFKEYRDLNMPSPPDDVSSSDYLDRCIFVPPNTKLVGLGRVTLRWDPDQTLLDHPGTAAITKGEARTWSPLNVRYAVEAENLEIVCKKGRYCIHDDSHNDESDRYTAHVYRNVRCYYYETADGYGFNNVIGFGLSTAEKLSFDCCHLEMMTGDHIAFYVHTASTNTSAAYSPSVTVTNSTIIGGAVSGGVGVNLQNLSTGQLDVETLFAGCSITGTVRMVNYASDRKQGFRLKLVRCTSGIVPTAPAGNTIPPKVYE